MVANWMRNHSTISFWGLWEQIHNPNFKPIEFDRFKAESGDNAFTLTPQQWRNEQGIARIVCIWAYTEKVAPYTQKTTKIVVKYELSLMFWVYRWGKCPAYPGNARNPGYKRIGFLYMPKRPD